MSVRNNTSSQLANEKNRFSLSISDTNEHDFPDTDGDDGTAGSGYNVGSASVVNASVINNQDQDATIRLEGTGARDADSFSEAVTIVDSVTVAASGGVETLVYREREDGSFAQLRVVVSFGSSPSGSNDTIVEYRKSQT